LRKNTVIIRKHGIKTTNDIQSIHTIYTTVAKVLECWEVMTTVDYGLRMLMW